MTEETWILQKCRRPKGYGTLRENHGSASDQPFTNYTVQPSDTLTSIAVKNDISVGQLRHFNRILLSGDKLIVPGTVLRIPLLPQKNTINSSNNTLSSNGHQTQTPSSSSTADNAERQHQLMIDPLVDTITPTSQSFHLDRPSDHLPERL
ncbi:unnamed protein product [Hymenolepis diminuta]|uniref:LysM domain-containing protein n=1 Tax=Hymenolepis diminuta TaxID=6216 RepID=A0A0R3SI94_HYMDI|nr:unnamed protein product [Hymenolepis diminuta]VUZ52898.1 unnamed protein product [Hymenolepis diminuta]